MFGANTQLPSLAHVSDLNAMSHLDPDEPVPPAVAEDPHLPGYNDLEMAAAAESDEAPEAAPSAPLLLGVDPAGPAASDDVIELGPERDEPDQLEGTILKDVHITHR